jgi:ADP-heptose:LPS heptosyltransferase
MAAFRGAARGVEDLIRAIALRTAVRLARATPLEDPTELRRRPSRVLFICEDAIGDIILSLPAIRAIAEAHPGNTVDLLTWDLAAQMTRGLPYINDVLVFPRYDRSRLGAARIIRARGPYDVVVDGMVLRNHVRTRSIAIMIASKARAWVGEAGRTNDHVFTIPVPPSSPDTRHDERMLKLASPFLSEHDTPPLRALLVSTDDERRAAVRRWGSAPRAFPNVLVNLSASSNERRWPDYKFAVALDYLRDLLPDARIVLVSLPADAPSARALADQVDGLAIIPTIRELMALVATSDLIITPDTAVCHMASAFERTLISLNPKDREIWGPYDTLGKRVVGPTLVTLDGLEPDAVIDAIREVVGVELPRIRMAAV